MVRSGHQDDAETAAYVVDRLKAGGHGADHSAEGRDGLRLALTGGYDALVVDRMLPGFDGLVIVKALREAGRLPPGTSLVLLPQTAQRRAEGMGAVSTNSQPMRWSVWG